MKVSSNKISDIRSFMQSYLQELYPVEEITSLFYILMETWCGMSRIQLHAGSREYLNESELLLVYDAIKELKTGKPIQYIIGKTSFCGLEFLVNPSVLIPRPETEELLELILKETPVGRSLKILDIGTGSGCIAIALKKNLSDAELWAMDISGEALDVAQQNATLNGTEINFILKDILSKNDEADLPAFDIIVSNPPYVLESEKTMMHKNVLEHEPHAALFVEDSHALQYYEAIFRFAIRNNKNSRLYFEINESKADEIIFLAKEFGISDICIVKDMNGKDRFFVGRNTERN